jgi:vomeronasal1 receptor
MGIFLFSQITVGMLGNSSILFYYVILIYTGKPLILKDLIIQRLTFVNFMSTISKGIPQILSDLEFKDFLATVWCLNS